MPEIKSRHGQHHQSIHQSLQVQSTTNSTGKDKPRSLRVPIKAGLIILAFFAGSWFPALLQNTTNKESASDITIAHERNVKRNIKDSIDTNNAESSIEKKTQQDINGDCCSLFCTRPSTTTCCLRCDEQGSKDTHEFLLALLEGLTIHIGTLFTKNDYKWLRSRAWAENSHIGNRINQGPFYFDWVRALHPEHICEIGFNGGHSGIVFLAATARSTIVTAFDLQQYKYSQPGLDYVQRMYPGRLVMLKGSSFDTVPAYSKEHGRSCDVFSVDGDHSLHGAKRDLLNAIEATKVGGWIIMDDMTMQPRHALKQVYEESSGALGNLHCLDDVRERVSHLDRYDNTTTFNIPVGWCWAQVLK